MLTSAQIEDNAPNFDRYEAQIEKIAKGNALAEFTVASVKKEYDRLKVDAIKVSAVDKDWTELRCTLEKNVSREMDINDKGNALFEHLNAEILASEANAAEISVQLESANAQLP